MVMLGYFVIPLRFIDNFTYVDGIYLILPNKEIQHKGECRGYGKKLLQELTADLNKAQEDSEWSFIGNQAGQFVRENIGPADPRTGKAGIHRVVRDKPAVKSAALNPHRVLQWQATFDITQGML